MSSRKRHAPPKPRPRPARATPRRARPPAGPGPGRRRPPFLPAAPRGPTATATAGGALTSVRVLLQVLLEQREVRHLVVAPSSSVSRGSGATWSGASRGAGGRAREGRRGGGTGRRGRARGAGRGPGTGPRAERLPDAGGGRAPRALGLAPPRLASPVRSGRPRGGRRCLLPPPSLPARPGPAARAHTLGRRRPHAEQRPELQPARDAAAGGRSRAGPPAARRALLGHGLVGRSPSPRAGRRSLPRAPSPGGTYTGGDPRPGGGRGSHPPGGGSAAPRAPGPVGSGW